MSKVEIVGTRGLLEDVLGCLRDMGVLHMEREIDGFIKSGNRRKLHSLLMGSREETERLFLLELKGNIEELTACLPELRPRESYIETARIIDTIANTVGRHLEHCKLLVRRREELRKEMEELDIYSYFFETLSTLFKDVLDTPICHYVGITIKVREALGPLRALLSRLTEDRFELLTKEAADGTVVGLIAVTSSSIERVRDTLGDERIPEFSLPPELDSLAFPEKVAHLRRKTGQLSADIEEISCKLREFATRWGPIYYKAHLWLNERLEMLGATAFAFQTEECFILYGWIPSKSVENISRHLESAYCGKVVLAEKEIHYEDLDRVPVEIKNPPYFNPFEIFTRLLPLPKYTSFDPTPFIAVFFPIFFGMILGDVGYGLVLAIIAALLILKTDKRGIVRKLATILIVASAYSIVFGLFFGEFIGELGAGLIAFMPFTIDRREAILPLMLFSLAVGVFHICLGFLLGMISAVKIGDTKKVLFKLLCIVIILLLTLAAAAYLDIFPGIPLKWTAIVLLVLMPLLIPVGGILAPLELIRSIGNIISYMRIMAIGLTSVLLAYVANRLGGAAGDIVLGVIIGGLLHALALLLGVFSTTIHSMRLHYVEFFDKFMEHGGKPFKPLKKP